MSKTTSKRLKRTASQYMDAVASVAPPRVANAIQDQQIAKLSKAVARLRGDQERKQVNTSLLNTGIGTSGLLVPLDFVLQGDTSLTRSGLRIRPSKLEWNLVLESEIADVFNSMRMMIVQSKKGDLSSADFSGIYIPSTEVQLSRYTVLYDKHTMLENYHSGTAADPRTITRYVGSHGSVKVNRMIHYPDGSGVSTVGRLYAWFISDSAVINHPDVEVFQAKLSFIDD